MMLRVNSKMRSMVTTLITLFNVHILDNMHETLNEDSNDDELMGLEDKSKHNNYILHFIIMYRQ